MKQTCIGLSMFQLLICILPFASLVEIMLYKENCDFSSRNKNDDCNSLYDIALTLNYLYADQLLDGSTSLQFTK
jgi:hypothetical protein